MAGRTTSGVSSPRVTSGQANLRVITGGVTARGSSAVSQPRVSQGLSTPRGLVGTNTFGVQGPPGTGTGPSAGTALPDRERLVNLVQQGFGNAAVVRRPDGLVASGTLTGIAGGEVTFTVDRNNAGLTNFEEYVGAPITALAGPGMALFHRFTRRPDGLVLQEEWVFDNAVTVTGPTLVFDNGWLRATAGADEFDADNGFIRETDQVQFDNGEFFGTAFDE